MYSINLNQTWHAVGLNKVELACKVWVRYIRTCLFYGPVKFVSWAYPKMSSVRLANIGNSYRSTKNNWNIENLIKTYPGLLNLTENRQFYCQYWQKQHFAIDVTACLKVLDHQMFSLYLKSNLSAYSKLANMIRLFQHIYSESTILGQDSELHLIWGWPLISRAMTAHS